MKKLLECLNLYHSDKCGHEDIDYKQKKETFFAQQQRKNFTFK